MGDVAGVNLSRQSQIIIQRLTGILLTAEQWGQKVVYTEETEVQEVAEGDRYTGSRKLTIEVGCAHRDNCKWLKNQLVV
jgi:hypothetical protein